MIQIQFDTVQVLMTPGGDEIRLIMTGKRHPIRCNEADEPIAWKTEVSKGEGVRWVRENLGVEPEILNPTNRPILA